MHFWGKTSEAEEQARQAQEMVFGAFLLLFGPLALLAAWALSRWRSGWRYLLALALPSLIWLQFLWVHLPIWSDTLLEALFLWWVGLVAAAPFGALLIRMWTIVWEFLRPRDLHEQLAEQQNDLEKQTARLRRQTAHQLNERMARQPHRLTLGLLMQGEHFPDHLGVTNHNGWLLLNDAVLQQHVLVVGATGAGKSETLKRIVAETLYATERDIFFVDGKGDGPLGAELAQMIYAARGQPVPVFQLGFDAPGAVYDGFCGQPADVYNRLCALVGISEASGNATYYGDINRNLLQLICYAPGGPPRSFADVRQRLAHDWLLSAYLDNAEEYATLEAMPAAKLESLRDRILPLAREFAPMVGEEGFRLETQRGAVFSLRTQSVGDTARRFLSFLIEDLKDFVGKRQQRPGLLIIDEFGVFDNRNIDAILMLARSANFGVILATQDVATLGDESLRRIILANTRTKLLLATDFPEEIATLAGTTYQVEASLQHEAGEATGMGSARIQHAFRVDMNEAARLQAGEAFLIRQRYAAKLHVKPVGKVDVTAAAIANFPKREEPGPIRKKEWHGQPLPLPKLELS